jgi:hypothetical protein
MAALLVNPIGLPIVVNPWTQGLYDTIDSLSAGSLALVVPDFEAAAYSESGPTMEATLKHYFSKDVRVVIVGFYIDAPMMARKVIANLEGASSFVGKVYGTDYVLLPMIMGGDVGAASLARDFMGMFALDAEGDPIAGMPIFAGVNDANDFAMTIAYGSEGATGFLVNQWFIPYGVPTGSCSGALGLTGMISSFQAGLNIGGAVGIRGAAEYEVLLGAPGAASAQMDTINIAHIIAVLVIVGLNIVYVYERISKPKGGNA